ncbi:MAG: large-conductance mechanosensitive channel protein MscL [Acidobacteria bacterium]|nr:large-conductance mechanosensitive channel protein MscL [Acidobacteriota bacterium]
MWNEFKEFINKGNVFDLAVGVIIGGAFGKIVSSVVDDLLMPLIGKALGGVDFASAKIVLGTRLEGDKVVEIALRYGSFIQHVIDFVLLALVVFLLVRAYNRMRAAAPPPPPSSTEVLLTEIRDALKAR